MKEININDLMDLCAKNDSLERMPTTSNAVMASW